MSTNCRKYLERSLASLLGFDIDDVADVIEHMLSFESKDDLLEHLTALLGRDDDDVTSFVDNVVKFQNGEIIDSTSTKNMNESEKELKSNNGLTNHEQISESSRRKEDEEALKTLREETQRLEIEEERKRHLQKDQEEQEQEQKLVE